MFLKNASVMRVEGMPNSALLNEENFKQHVPIPNGSALYLSYGFVVIPTFGEWWREFSVDADNSGIKRNAYALQFMIEEKVIPAYQIKDLLDKKIAQEVENYSRQLSRKEIQEHRENILIGLLQKAPIRKITAPVFIVHNNQKEQTIISSLTGKNKTRLFNALMDTFQTLKTKTIHFNELSHGLSTRLKNTICFNNGEYSQDDNGNNLPMFAPFAPFGNLLLKRKQEKIRMQINEVDNNNLFDFLNSENPFMVTEIVLGDRVDDDNSTNYFKIDHNFNFKSIKWADVEIDDAEGADEDIAHQWDVLATIRCTLLLGWVNAFSSMFGFTTESDEAAVVADPYPDLDV